MPRHCIYLCAKLRHVEKLIELPKEGELSPWLAVSLFASNAARISTEILSTLKLRQASWLLLRTLWHNAGHLAWFLHGPNTLEERIDIFIDDHAIRAESILLKEPTRMFGNIILTDNVEDVATKESIRKIKSLAASARNRLSRQGSDRSDWGRISSKDLEKALSKSLEIANMQFNKDGNNDLDIIYRYSRHAIVKGDNLAHPNPFTMLNQQELVNLEKRLITRQDGAIDDDRESVGKLFVLEHLLVAHCLIIAAFEPTSVDLEKIMKVIIGDYQRKKVISN